MAFVGDQFHRGCGDVELIDGDANKTVRRSIDRRKHR